MKEIGIKEIARRVGEFTKTHLMDVEVCATVIGNEIVLCMRGEPAYIVTGEQFTTDTPRMLLTAGINIINRMVFDLSPEEASALITSTIPKIAVRPSTDSSPFEEFPGICIARVESGVDKVYSNFIFLTIKSGRAEILSRFGPIPLAVIQRSLPSCDVR